MAEVFFFLAAIGAIAGAVGTVSLRNPFYAVLALVCHLLALAALFLLLRAEFVAAAQVVVYAGAVMVLYVFVVAYVGGQDQPLGAAAGGGAARRLGAVRGRAVRRAVHRRARLGPDARSAPRARASRARRARRPTPASAPPAEMGRLFLTKFLVAFEAASLLLLIAAVGAVILARRRSGLEDPREISVADVMRGDAGHADRRAAPRRCSRPGGRPNR